MSTPAERPAHLFHKDHPNRASGRKVGSRNLLADRFFKDLYGLWEEQGDAALRRAFFDNPVAVVQIVAKLMPAKLEISTPTAGLTDEKLAAMIEYAEARLASMNAPASVTISDEPSMLPGGGGSPQADDARGEVIEGIHYTSLDSDPVSAAGPPSDPPISSSAETPKPRTGRDVAVEARPYADEDEVDPADLF